MTTEASDKQRVVMPRQGVNDEVFVRRVVVGAGSTIQ